MTGVIVAIDSGGTRTTSEMRTGDGSVVRRFESLSVLSGYLDPRMIPETMQQILAPLESAYRQEGLNGQPISVFIAAAGYAEVSREDYFDAINDVMSDAFGGNIRLAGVANDAVTLLLGYDADGVVVAGTGSNVIMRNGPREMHQTGGHDWVAADQGSAFWIGLDAIRQVAVDFEARDESWLLNRFCELNGIDTRNGLDERTSRQIIAKFRTLSIADSRMKAEVAKFTHSVCQAAENGDINSQDIVKRQSEALGDLVAQGIRRHFTRDRIEAGLRIVECGGVLSNDFYRATFEAHTRMRMRGGVEGRLDIDWVRVGSGIEGTIKAAQRMSTDADTWLSLPRMFRPVIEMVN